MVTQNPKVRYTYDDYCQLPDDKRYELIDGEFHLAPSPDTAHQWASLKLARLMADFVERLLLGVVFTAPYDVILSANDTFQPDILFVSEGRRSIITQRACEGPPDLVVEFLSPSTSRQDLILKRARYAQFGVQEYWIANTTTRSIEVLSLVRGEYVSQGTYTGNASPASGVLSGFAFPVQSIFLRA